MLNNNTVNKVILMGRVGRDPRRHFQNGATMYCFPLITTERINRNGGVDIHEECHQVRISEHLIDIRQITAGKMVYMQGKLRTTRSTDEFNAVHYKTEIVAYTVEPVDVKLQVI